MSITGEELVGILERLSITHGFPAFLRMDNGRELTCRALATWAEGIVDLAFVPPGEPWKNGYVESFHSRKRDEFLNINTFPSLLHARVELTDWHHEYNNIRRTSAGTQALATKPPANTLKSAPAPNPTDSQSDRTENRRQATWR